MLVCTRMLIRAHIPVHFCVGALTVRIRSSLSQQWLLGPVFQPLEVAAADVAHTPQSPESPDRRTDPVQSTGPEELEQASESRSTRRST